MKHKFLYIWTYIDYIKMSHIRSGSLLFLCTIVELSGSE